MRNFLTAIFLIVFTSQAVAQQQFDISGKTKGDVIQWRAHNGNTSVIFLRRSGKYYKLAFSRDSSKGQPLKATFWATRKGEIVKAKVGGVTTRFSPHDCSLTVGRCVSMERTRDLGRRTIIWNASVKNGVWHYTKHHTKQVSANLIEKGRFTVDKYGYYIDRTYSTKIDGVWQSQWTKRIK